MYEKLIAMVESKLSSSELIEFELLLNEFESATYSSGYDAGKEEGYDVGSNDAYGAGYDDGYAEGISDVVANQE